jgi:Fe-Mn family superoxide dismutase
MNRRDTLKVLATMTAVGLTGRSPLAQAQSAAPDGPFKLPPLGYDFGALEPHIDAQTMMIHHDRHHAAYVNAANALAANIPLLREQPVERILVDLPSIPEASRIAVRNNVGGHWNHSFFWDLMHPGGAKEPVGGAKSAIDDQFGSVEKLKERINAAGLGRFGSGWSWLVVGKDKKLDVISTPNQDNPLMEGMPGVVLGVDVWEHAYYLKYQNRRNEYLAAWWNTVNWDKVEANFRKAMS